MERPSLYRLEVAPLIILPLGRSPYFSYTSGVPLKKGALVSISFGPRTIEGIVFDCQTLPGKKPAWMKPVSRTIEENALTEKQCLLAAEISREYCTPLGKTLKHFLVKKTKERISTKTTSRKKAVPRATKEEQTLLQSLSQTASPCYIDTGEMTDPKKLWLLIGKQATKAKRQVLLLVPEITLIYPLQARFQEYFGSELVILHSKLSAGALSSAWERIRSGEATLIIATRQGLFAPFRDLATIIVTEEQDESYKQWDMSPRYQGKQVAAMLATLHRATLVLTSGTPSTESLFSIEAGRLRPLRPINSHPPLGTALTIINLKLERYRKNFSPLSEALTQALRDTLAQGKQALLYINRQGMNAFSVCDQCKNTFRCQKCDHPLSSTKDGYFRCVACGFTTGLFPNCPTCGHLSFRHIGFGTEKVEREVAKLFPRARVARLDSSTLRLTKSVETLLQKGARNEIDILVGTQMALKDPPLPKLALIAMIDADSLLLFPHFRADERLFQDLSRAARQVKSAGQVFIQTFHPESAFLQKASTVGSQELLKAILADRKGLSYPPFFRFITLTCQGRSEKEASNRAQALAAHLEKKIPQTCRVRPSSTVRQLKKEQRFESDVLLRLPATDTVLPETLITLLHGVAKDCLIDVDPITPK